MAGCAIERESESAEGRAHELHLADEVDVDVRGARVARECALQFPGGASQVRDEFRIDTRGQTCCTKKCASTKCGASDEGHDHAAKSGKLTGEVVDITCFMDHDSKGEKHSACARKCIEKGLPVGLLVGDKLNAIILGSHDSPNEKLAPFAGKLVTMTGSISEKSGMRVIDMDAVEPATTPAK